MARGAGGAVLDEPPSATRRERRLQSRPDRARSRGPSEPGTSRGEGVRQARRARSEQRRFWFVLMPGLAVLLAIAVALGAAIRGDQSGPAAAPVRTTSGAAARLVGTLLLGHRGADGRMDTLMLVGSTRSGASVLLLPVSTQVEVPSLGLQVLADLPNEGSPGLVQTTIENLLGVKVARTVLLDDAGLDAALAPSSPLPVDLHRSVQFAGSPDAPLPAGAHTLPVGAASRLLVARQPGSELDRLVTVQDVVDGWMHRLANASVARRTLAVRPDLAGLVAAAKHADSQTDTLPVQSVATGGSERFEPRAGDVHRYLASAFPESLLTSGRRPRIEVLNGTGAVGLAQTIAAKVVPAGGQVTLTGNLPTFGLKKTQVVYYSSQGRGAAQRMLSALGCGVLKVAGTPIGVVDVTILAGADCFPTGAPPGP